MIKKNVNKESGRSMVEMLGVLAVIGVLSVAGIAGYTTAMQSYRTNEILNATSMFYVLAMSQNQGNGPSGKINYSNVGGTNPSGATLEYENNAITITFNDAKDCTAAKNKLGDKATDDCANKKLTVNFGESTPSPVADDDPSTAGYYGCDGHSTLLFWGTEENNYEKDESKNITCPDICNQSYSSPTYFSSIAAAKSSACKLSLEGLRAECLASNKYWLGDCYDTKAEAEAAVCPTVAWDGHEGECM